MALETAQRSTTGCPPALGGSRVLRTGEQSQPSAGRGLGVWDVGQRHFPLGCSWLEPRRPFVGCRGSQKQYHLTPHTHHTHGNPHAPMIWSTKKTKTVPAHPLRCRSSSTKTGPSQGPGLGAQFPGSTGKLPPFAAKKHTSKQAAAQLKGSGWPHTSPKRPWRKSQLPNRAHSPRRKGVPSEVLLAELPDSPRI